jgi:thiol-disulfide isomerase/thioredoxin
VRLPDVIGVLAALVAGILIIAYLLSGVLNVPIAAPTPTSPTAPPIAMPTPEPTSTGGSPGPPIAMPTPEPTFSEILAIGSRAPDFSLPALGGGTVDSAAYAGRPLWINFMATWCPQCVDELPMMEGMQASLGDEMTILVIDVDEDPELVQAFIDGLEVDLPVGLDEDGAVQRTWSAYVLPSHFFLDGEHVLRDVLFGGAPRDAFVESIQAILPDVDLGE